MRNAMNLSLFWSEAYESNKIVCSDNFTLICFFRTIHSDVRWIRATPWGMPTAESDAGREEHHDARHSEGVIRRNGWHSERRQRTRTGLQDSERTQQVNKRYSERRQQTRTGLQDSKRTQQVNKWYSERRLRTRTRLQDSERT